MGKKVVKTILKIIIIILIIIAGYFAFMTITDYKPDKIVSLNIENNQNEIVKIDEKISILTFNIGYCGLDEGQDFFMDGGNGSHSESKEKTIENLEGIIEFINKNKTDIIFLQELDIDSTRSFHINQYKKIKENLDSYASTFVYNYKVPWVPVPITKPHGSVKAGLATFSKYNITEAQRYQYPGKEKWPRQLVLLDRCFIENRISVEGGKELVILNSHLSAYDKGGEIRKQQLGFLREHIIDEYNKGNYIVVGGDWNHLIPGTDPTIFETTQKWPDWLVKIPQDFKPEGFKWEADKNIPSNRTVNVPYKKGINFLSVIDGFLVSPNVEVLKVQGYDMEFKYSDHNPVIVDIVLK